MGGARGTALGRHAATTASAALGGGGRDDDGLRKQDGARAARGDDRVRGIERRWPSRTGARGARGDDTRPAARLGMANTFLSFFFSIFFNESPTQIGASSH